MTTFSTEFLSHTLNFRNHPNRICISGHSNPNFIVTSSTPLLNEGNTNNRRARMNQEQFRVNETRPKLDQNCDFRDTNSIKALKKSCESAKYDESLYLLKLMVNRGYKPDVFLCIKLIKGLFTSKKIEKAILVMEILENHGEPNVYVYNAVLKGVCKANRDAAAYKVLDKMKKRGVFPNVVTYNILIGNLCRRGKLDLALRVMDQLLKYDCKPTVKTYSILIEATIINGGIDEAMKLLDEMSSRGLPPNLNTYRVVVNGMCRGGLLDRAFEYLDKMISDCRLPDIICYNSILASLCKTGHVGEALYIFEKLSEVGCPLDASSYDTLFRALWRSGNKIRALWMILEMLSKGIDPDEITYNSLISCLCEDRLVDQAIELLVDMMESRKFLPTVKSYNAVILELCKMQRVIDAIEVLAAMNQSGCLPNDSTYRLLIQGIGFGGWRNDAIELANSLVNMDAISEGSFMYLTRRFSVIDAHKELAISE